MLNKLDWLPYQSWMNAAGTGGFAIEKEFLKAFPAMKLFVTNPVSLSSRQPSNHRGIYPSEGGFLLHSGWPNPGLHQVIKKYKGYWVRSSIPVIVNLLVNEPTETKKMVQMLEEIDNILALEFSFGKDASAALVFENLEAGFGKLPVIAKIPMERVQEEWLDEIRKKPVDAISLQPPRGIIKNQDRLVQGRLFGAGILPITMQAVKSAVRLNLPILAGAGVIDLHQLDVLFELGMYAFQFYEFGWRGIL
ncbi:MAG: hypothetical protein CL609_07075 [Anaerolineaceae bacterium]|nr:hypothetical protein [Anaerolineaceae bacterium]